MLYELILINKIEQRAKIIFLRVEVQILKQNKVNKPIISAQDDSEGLIKAFLKEAMHKISIFKTL